MILNNDEKEVWELQKGLFYPGGVANDDAFHAYLKKYSQLTDPRFAVYSGYASYPEQLLLGVILKHTPDSVFQEAFTTYYSQFRTGENSAEFDTFLGDLAVDRPNVLATALKSSAPSLDFTKQVMVLRDAQKWLPGSNIKDYAAPKLLKTKPSVIAKQINPRLEDMPYLVALSATLLRNEDPQSRALGDTIAKGSFIARYGMPIEYKYGINLRLPTVKYCSDEAFTLLQRHGVTIAPSVLLQQVQLRYNAQSVVFDALAYPVRVLEDSNSPQSEKLNALDVLDEVLTFSESKPDHAGFNTVVESALSRLHAVVATPERRLRIEDRLTLHMLGKNSYGCPSMASVLSTVERTNEALLFKLAGRAFDSIKPREKLYFLQNATIEVEQHKRKLTVALDSADTAVQNAFFALLPATQVEEFISGALYSFFDPATSSDNQDRTSSLKDMLNSFAQFDWPPENAAAFRASPLAATTILLYLYMAAAGHTDHLEPLGEAGIPYTDWTPLPFLKNMYPEKMELWNRMTLGLLQMPMEETKERKKEQYCKVMGSMFQAFSNSFLVDGPSLGITQGVIESLDANPLDYFMDAHKKKGPLLDLALPDDMFAFN